MLAPISFRPLGRSDLPLLQKWFSEPHVDAWWHSPLDISGLHAKYGPRIDGTEPTHVFIFDCEGEPTGWIQWYRWSDYPEHAEQLGAELTSAGLDLGIGKSDMLGKGLGPRAIHIFARDWIFIHANIGAVVTDPEERNVRSLRAFEKAGFIAARTVQLRGENEKRRVMRLERPG